MNYESYNFKEWAWNSEVCALWLRKMGESD